MASRRRNWLLTFAAILFLWLVHPFFVRNLEAFMEKRGLDQVINRALERFPRFEVAMRDYFDELFAGSGFWSGAFVILLIWGALEISYVWLRRRRRTRETAIVPEYVRSSGSSASVHFVPETSTIEDSFNVSSLDDNGTGDFTINFVTPLDEKTLTVQSIAGALAPSTFSFDTIDGKIGSIRVKFDREPEVVRLRFGS